MQQHRRVQELNDRGQFDVIFTLITGRPGRQQHEQGPQSLAAGFDQIGRNFLDQRDVGIQVFPDQIVHQTKIVLDG